MLNTLNATDQIRRAIRGHRRGWVFTPHDLLSPGLDPRKLGVILGRLEKEGLVRKLARGLYDFPKLHETLGMLAPHTEQIAQALARPSRLRLQAGGPTAANQLRLSEQVPAKLVYRTDGRARSVRIRKMEIRFMKTAPRFMAAAGRPSGTVIQALRHLGKANVTTQTLASLQRSLPSKAKKALMKDRALAPAWMRPHLDAIAHG